MPEIIPYRMGIVGKSLYGKSFLAKRLLRYSPNWLFFDPTGTVSEGTVITGLWELKEHLEMDPKYIKITYRPEGDREHEFDEICQLVMNLGNLLFLVDEMHEFVTPHSIPEEFSKVLHYGRHKQVKICGIVQRFIFLNLNFFSQLEILVTVKQDLPQDLDWIRKNLMVHGREDLPDTIRTLNVGEYVIVKDDITPIS